MFIGKMLRLAESACSVYFQHSAAHLKWAAESKPHPAIILITIAIHFTLLLINDCTVINKKSRLFYNLIPHIQVQVSLYCHSAHL